VLGLGRNLYASGNDYASLYGEVTGLIGGMTVPGIDGTTSMGDLADILLGLPEGIATAMFNLLYPQATTTAPVVPPPPVVTPGGGAGAGTGGGGGGGGIEAPWNHFTQIMARMAENVEVMATNSGTALQHDRSEMLTQINIR